VSKTPFLGHIFGRKDFKNHDIGPWSPFDESVSDENSENWDKIPARTVS
jgi:hypothetical protein